MSNISIKTDSVLSRILLAAVILVCIISVFFAFVSLFADSISKNAQDQVVANFATELAPYNPQAFYTIAVLQENSFIPEDIPRSLSNFETAVSLSPNDYRLWLALGKARERNGDNKGAEFALQKASELAPNYARVQWAYGNILLRQGKNKKAFDLIGQAVKSDPKYADPAVTTAWQAFDGDIDKIKEVVGDSSYTKAALAIFFAKEEKYKEAVSFWNTIPEKEKRNTFKKQADALIASLIKAKRFRYALDVKNQIANKTVNKLQIGQIQNGGFEQDIKVEKAEIFEWNLDKGKQPQIGIDLQQKTEGNQSLVMVFRGPDNRDFRGISQIVAVEGEQNYTFNLSYKSNLDTSAKILWEIINPVDDSVIASTNIVDTKTDWKSLNVSFTTPENAQGIMIRLVRSECGSKLCPTTGRLWFDNISLD